MIEAPKVPLNYFGRGKDYQLPDDQTIINQIMAEFDQWERDHPDDPNGENALALYAKGEVLESPKKNEEPKTQGSTSEILYTGETTQIRLELPTVLIDKLKAHAKFKRKRPRDIIIRWIELYCVSR